MTLTSPRPLRILSFLAVSAVLLPITATALDRPISGKKLQLRRSSNGKEKRSTTNSQGLSSDCAPGGSDGSTDLGVIGVELSPLVTSTASASNPDGLFCSGQTMSNNNRL